MILNLLSNLIGNSNNKTNFSHKLLLTNTQVSKIRKAFANGSSADIKFLKTQLSKVIQSGGILDDLIAAIPQGMFLAPELAPKLAEKVTRYYINKGINELNKKFASRKGSGITLRYYDSN